VFILVAHVSVLEDISGENRKEKIGDFMFA